MVDHARILLNRICTKADINPMNPSFRTKSQSQARMQVIINTPLLQIQDDYSRKSQLSKKPPHANPPPPQLLFSLCITV